MTAPNHVTGELLGRSLLVIAQDLESVLDLGRLAHETCVVDARDLAGVPDEHFDSVVVQAHGDLDGLLREARARLAPGGAVLVDARSGGRLQDGGWRAVDVVGGGHGMCLVQVEATPGDGGAELNLLLRATGQAAADGSPEPDASWTIRSRALSGQGAVAAPTVVAPGPGGPPAPRPARARPAPPRRKGWRGALPETLARNGPHFRRRLVLLAVAALLWTAVGAVVAGLTGTGWLAVALWVVVGLQMAQLVQSEVSRRSLKLTLLRASTRR